MKPQSKRQVKRINLTNSGGHFSSHAGPEHSILEESEFHQLMRLERKRAKRSNRPFLLVHLDVSRFFRDSDDDKPRRRILNALTDSIRDTDLLGWSKHEKVIGVMFVELGAIVDNTLMATMLLRVSDALRKILALEEFRQIDISFQCFPEPDDEMALPQLVPQLFAMATAGSE
jgi:hypothetical protein